MGTNKKHQLQTTTSQPHFIEILATNKKAVISEHLSEFKENGLIKYEKTLAIGFDQRIPQLVKTKEGRESVMIALSVSLKSAFANLNLKYSMNSDQMVDLADRIIDESHEDQLALEDVLLFLQKMLVGEYGMIEYKMDIALFFQLFEGYRQQRHEALINHRSEQHSNYKVMGKGDEPAKDRTADPATMLDLLQTFHLPDEDQKEL